MLVHFHMYVKNSCLKLSTSLMPLWDMKWWGGRSRRTRGRRRRGRRRRRRRRWRRWRGGGEGRRRIRRRRRRLYTGLRQIGIGKWNLVLILGSRGKRFVRAESDILLLGCKCLVPFLQGVDKSFPLPNKGWASFPVHCSHWPRPLAVSLLPILNRSFERTYSLTHSYHSCFDCTSGAACYLKTLMSIDTTTEYQNPEDCM